MSLVPALLAAVLYAGGVWLLLGRNLLRAILGVSLLGHGSVVLLVVAGGPAGTPAFVGGPAPSGDPLPQALGLTAVVITFALVAFLLALAWRSIAVRGDDRIVLDREDRRIASTQPPEEP